MQKGKEWAYKILSHIFWKIGSFDTDYSLIFIVGLNVLHGLKYYWVRIMVVNATFNNNSVISWRSVLLVEETGVLGEDH
jgi:hypothetical protein